MKYQSTLSALLRSRNPATQILGGAIAFLFFLPAIFQILDSPDLSLWRRLEKATIAAGQTLLTVSAAAIDPRSLQDGEGDEE